MAGASTEERCPLCGQVFDPATQGCRPSCPLAKGCSVVCCPGCGYSFPQERAGLAGRLRNMLDRFERRRTGT
ncbi:MAG TPA: hypothetical protein VLT61_12370 [Anaeromyxobacteraceae bacterium]|nr:hypothetical protein [Anaeromyxobacteraceae bacterium]